MQSYKQVAEHAMMTVFLNSYLRESNEWCWLIRNEWPKELLKPTACGGFCFKLDKQCIELYVCASYYSLTGRHQFVFPVHYRTASKSSWVEADYITLVSLMLRELSLAHGNQAIADEFMLRVIQSCHNIACYVKARASDLDELYGYDSSFIEGEQSLLFGHLMHPTPKSREGMNAKQDESYSPEYKGSFQLHYFKVAAELVSEDSAAPYKLSQLIAEELGEFASHDDNQYDGQYAWVPVHPLQANWLLGHKVVQRYMRQGSIVYFGPRGEQYTSTSSLRTLYRGDSAYMLKCSLPVKVTNSLRVLKQRELKQAVDIYRLFAERLRQASKRFAGFELIFDPAYMTVKLEGMTESGFELLLRENPFQGEEARHSCLIAGLTQDALPHAHTRLFNIIHEISVREGRSLEKVSVAWFRAYLAMTLLPIVWLYVEHGIAMEAHQQNGVLHMENGYPKRFYFRDQGYFFIDTGSAAQQLQAEHGFIQSADICDEQTAADHLTYYLICNHLLGLINGFGVAGLVDEQVLLTELKEQLEQLRRQYGHHYFLERLLTSETLPCKSNLLTRLYDMDEMDRPLATQSIYVQIPNPLVVEVSNIGQEVLEGGLV